MDRRTEWTAAERTLVQTMADSNIVDKWLPQEAGQDYAESPSPLRWTGDQGIHFAEKSRAVLEPENTKLPPGVGQDCAVRVTCSSGLDDAAVIDQ